MHYFLTIVEERSLTRAAEKLYISQPALSKYLGRLENEAGVKLFTRHNNTLFLTEAGQAYYEGLRQIQEIYKKTLLRLEDIRQDGERRLSIGVTGERTQRFLGILLRQLYEQYPTLHVQIIESPVWELAEKLKCEQIDLAIYAVTEEDNDLTYVHLREEDVVLAVPDTHRLAHLGGMSPHDELMCIDLHELRSDHFVLLRKNTAQRRCVDDYFAQNGFYPNEVIEAKGSYSSMVFVDSGLAVGFCARNYRFDAEHTRYLALKNPFYYCIALCHKKNAYLTKPMQSFIRLAQQKAELL